MKSFEWNKETQTFLEVDNPTYFEDLDCADESIAKAGYSEEITSYEDQTVGATIRVYINFNQEKPRFFIDIMGMNYGIATLVARDFPALIETLKQIHPLISLIGLDQFNSARISEQVEKRYPNR